MANEELIAASETAYELISDYARDLGKFIGQLQDEATAVSNTLSNMHNYWDGSLYDDFARNIKAKLQKIATELARAEDLRKTLEMSAQEMKITIEILQAASDV